jgi:hypothetical protein
MTNGTGFLSDAVLTSQVQVLNDAFNGFGFTFRLEQINRITSDRYFGFDADTPAGVQIGEDRN